MTDNQLMQILLSVISSGLTARGYSATVQQGYQPTQQGVTTGPAVILHNIGNKRYGSPNNKSRWASGDTVAQTESFVLERTYQVDALSIQDPKQPSRPTPFDLVDVTAAILQSELVRATLWASNIGILRITDIRQTSITDDRERNEQSPSFDFTVNYTQSHTGIVPAVIISETGIYPI